MPEAPDMPVSRPGDLWQLEAHRLMCGDGADVAAATQPLNGVIPHLMDTEPPYGVMYDPD